MDERKKVVYEVVLKKHGIFSGKTDEEITKEVKKSVDMSYYQNSDDCEVRIVKIENFG